MKCYQIKKKGFSLIEIMLVLGIVSSILVMLIRVALIQASQASVNVAAIQIQQVLNAGMAFYITNGYWPSQTSASAACGQAASISTLQNANYLPLYFNPPYIGATYTVSCNASSGTFSVTLTLPVTYPNATAITAMIAAKVPLSSTSFTTPVTGVAPVAPVLPIPAQYQVTGQSPYQCNCTTSWGNTSCQTCYQPIYSLVPGTGTSGSSGSAGVTAVAGGFNVTAQIILPSQTLNSAHAISFAAYYHHGGCVPAPTCPTNMAPDILVVPVALYGLNDLSTDSTYYPLYGFTAYANGGANTSSSIPNSTPDVASNVADCENPGVATQCNSTCASGGPGGTCTPIATVSTQLYWRVCLMVRTEKGVVGQQAGSAWAQYATILALTRCVPANEKSGSDFTVWTQ